MRKPFCSQESNSMKISPFGLHLIADAPGALLPAGTGCRGAEFCGDKGQSGAVISFWVPVALRQPGSELANSI